MKKFLVMTALFALSIGSMSAQSTKELAKEREEVQKLSRKELTEKASKAAKKEAKSLAKEGWETSPGALPIEKQLDKSYLMQYEYDEDGYPKYTFGEAMSTGSSYDAAKLQALELAKQNLAGQIQSEMTAIVENTVANEQLEPEEAASLARTVLASKNKISQSLGRTIPIMEVYRTLSNKNKEVLVRIAYNSELAKKAALNAVRENLEEEGASLHDDLDKLLGW